MPRGRRCFGACRAGFRLQPKVKPGIHAAWVVADPDIFPTPAKTRDRSRSPYDAESRGSYAGPAV